MGVLWMVIAGRGADTWASPYEYTLVT